MFTTPLLDDFNRANENPLSQGGNWQARNASAMQILSNLAGPGQIGGGRFQAVYIGVGPFTDCEFYLTVTTSNDWSVVTARNAAGTNASLNNMYAVQVGGGSFILLRLVNNTETLLVNLSHAVANGDQIGIRCIGSTIDGWHKPAGGSWGMVAQAVDATFNAGYGGMQQGAAGAFGTGRLDDFSGGDLAAAQAQVLLPHSVSGQLRT